ncbi:hypothetical protein INR79_22350 [Vibrio sp. SCSIO 43132]|uniref:hypothetical protein n=1 Tax=Vibrio sp. SCSIO 43132 TaxID=2779363 RepID=UPI001CA8D3FD|nr:hypothetical protein [Vibrio sp. SCSIO 43132]UAB73885.1 hypothetical protein INR79_22350 [Vibrio sp. SCSIO 43132]
MKGILFTIALLMSSSVFADANLPAQNISGIATGWGSEGNYLFFDGNNIVEGCTNNRVRIQRDHPMAKDILSIALSAFHTDRKVIVRVSGCLGSDMNGIAIHIVKN